MIFINDQAYIEFKELLDNANVESYSVRISIDRYGCSGPIFGVFIDEATDEDDVEIVKDITFVVEKSVNEQFGGFIIVSNEENDGNGIGLKPVVTPSSKDFGSSCGGCCGGCN